MSLISGGRTGFPGRLLRHRRFTREWPVPRAAKAPTTPAMPGQQALSSGPSLHLTTIPPAVWAPRLDRASIFEALRTKRTYGTTGERIYLELLVDNQPPGSEIVVKKEPKISLQICGTQPLEWVELIRFSQKTKVFSTVGRWTPNRRELQEELTDPDYSVPSIYYLRLRQQGLVEGRPAMAWSSPIWVTNESNPWWNDSN